jgi:superfamily I DNA/RNA helicase
VGTNKSAKGLEFKHVLVPLVDPILMQSGEPTDEYDAEQWRQRRRELYVAMTRARDTLWIGCVVTAPQAKSAAMPRLVT